MLLQELSLRQINESLLLGSQKNIPITFTLRVDGAWLNLPKAAYVTIPGKGKLPLTYASDRGSPSYWEVPWSTAGYPVGTVNFTVTVVAKPLSQWGLPQYARSKVRAQAGIFSQKGFYSGSDLTIVAP